MAYGTLKCDNIVFDNGGTDKLVTVSGLFFSTSGALTVTGTISGGNVTAPTATFATLTGTTTAGTTASFEIMRDSSGVNAGGLYPHTNLGGWSNVPSSRVNIWQLQ